MGIAKPTFPRFQRESVLANGLVATWPMTEGSGTNVFDYSGNNNNAVFVGPGGSIFPAWAGGRSGSAVFLGFPNSVIGLNGLKVPVSGTNPYSVCVSFNTTNTDATGTNNCLVSWGGTGTGDAFLLDIENGAPWIRCGGNTAHVGSGYNDGKWHRITITKPSGGTVTGFVFYVDGIKLGAPTTTGSTTLNLSTANVVHLGYYYNGATHSFGGTLDDVRIYNRVLSTQEIALDYMMNGG